MRSREEFPILLSPPLTLRPSLFFSAFCLPAKPQTTTNSSGGETANNNIISSRLLFQKSHQSSEHQQPASTIKLSVAIGCPREDAIVQPTLVIVYFCSNESTGPHSLVIF
ncbi:uncharacterized protein LOC107022764 isoform X2 [Solanum pennellii]|uniref:Uncharacterized protein LOC107022764 isoform X2 n=1 Tax=Solanum pennellii TaxID=28526 RepID=A0ABM1H0Z0_SOLPN|nr:uncharacterized protein LOC107022764 isoform X2 [Solanum pennellii]